LRYPWLRGFPITFQNNETLAKCHRYTAELIAAEVNQVDGKRANRISDQDPVAKEHRA